MLLLCTGNSARSILAESILQKDGAGRFRAFSAGSRPKDTINPLTLKVLEAFGYPTTGLRSKNWQEFAAPGAPKMDFVFTLGDDAAGEVSPVWPGLPLTARWGTENPAAVAGSDVEKERTFVSAFRCLKNRIFVFVALPLSTIGNLSLGEKIAGDRRYGGCNCRS